MENSIEKTKHGRSILSTQQTEKLIDNIKKIQLTTKGLTKRAVINQAFEQTFGAKEQWPIQIHSSTVSRYWQKSRPSTSVNLSKRRRRSSQPLIDDLRRSAIPHVPQIPTVPLECVFHDCPWCRKPIRALIVAAATVMKHEQTH